MLIFHGALALCCLVAVIIIKARKGIFFDLAKNSVGLVNELINDADEDEQIELIQKKTNRLAFSLIKLLLLIIIAFTIGGSIVAGYIIITEASTDSLSFTSLYAIIAITIGATVGVFIPIGKKSNSDYSELSQLLHYMALDNYNISNKLFKRESKKINEQGFKTRKDFVIISGLARAGTTSLMNDLSAIDEFVSLSYANMPFVMIPNTWKKFYNPDGGKVKERSHKDGIMIGYNSSEALEEYFFKAQSNDSYIDDLQLNEYTVSEEVYQDYLNYQRNIKLDDKKLYLAKNNNFILRYRSMRSFNDDFIMVILFRDPVSHASSLLEKHKYYCEMQQTDPFVKDYMNWLGHHEFGLNQKPFAFDGKFLDLPKDKTTMDYWLKIWINYYEYALDIDHKNTIFIDYDSYCRDPKETVQNILNKIGITNNPVNNKPFINKRKMEGELPEVLVTKAKSIYQGLLEKMMNN